LNFIVFDLMSLMAVTFYTVSSGWGISATRGLRCL
jgi:hypothetical protein